MAPTYFGCDSCQRTIPSTDPRIHCLDCDEFDLCANCALGERFTGAHLPTHRTCVFKMSGGGAQASVTGSIGIVYGAPTPVAAAAPTQPILSPPMSPPPNVNSPLPPLPQRVAAVSPPPPQHPARPAAVPPRLPARQRHSTQTVPLVSSGGTSAGGTTPQDGPAVGTPPSGATSAYTMPPRGGAIATPPGTMGGTPPPNQGSAGPVYSTGSRISSIGMATPAAAGGTPPPYESSGAGTGYAASPHSGSATTPAAPTANFSAASGYAASSQGGTAPQTATAGSTTSSTMPPRDNTGTPAQTVVAGWGPFFGEDMSPTPVFCQFMDAIFTYLDTGRTGYLVPEAYSHFLIDQGYVGQENTWNANLIPTFGQTKEEVADAALKRVYDLFSIEYILRPRPRDPNAPVDALTQQLKALGPDYASFLTPPSVSGGLMPLLTRRGFIDITAVELLTDPSRGWGDLSRAAKIYDSGLGAVRGWGAMPRGVLPEIADARMLESVARITAFSKEQGERELAAAVAKSRIEQRGRDAVLDLFGNTRVRYVYN
ncbi:hypothetical protein C8R43DRAFT_1037764 [Mycena crocata]|nr:hypothetical protein C8R43DRAFT_1037764 [Mycena crocata]